MRERRYAGKVPVAEHPQGATRRIRSEHARAMGNFMLGKRRMIRNRVLENLK
jgi:hypothetical protein